MFIQEMTIRQKLLLSGVSVALIGGLTLVTGGLFAIPVIVSCLLFLASESLLLAALFWPVLHWVMKGCWRAVRWIRDHADQCVAALIWLSVGSCLLGAAVLLTGGLGLVGPIGLAVGAWLVKGSIVTMTSMVGLVSAISLIGLIKDVFSDLFHRSHCLNGQGEANNLSLRLSLFHPPLPYGDYNVNDLPSSPLYSVVANAPAGQNDRLPSYKEVISTQVGGVSQVLSHHSMASENKSRFLDVSTWLSHKHPSSMTMKHNLSQTVRFGNDGLISGEESDSLIAMRQV